MTEVLNLLSSPMDIPNGRPQLSRLNGVAPDSEEEDTFPDTPRSLISNPSPSPRCEAYVMTGEKMLRLNSKISPSYAKARQEQLPPDTPVLEPLSPRRRGPFDDFPSLHHKTTKMRRRFDTGVPNSQSEHVLGETPNCTGKLPSGDEPSVNEVASSVTVNALCRGVSAKESDCLSSPETPLSAAKQHITCKSEPCSPAKYCTAAKNGDWASAEDNTLVIRVNSQDSDHSLPSTPLKEKLLQMGKTGNGFVMGEKDQEGAVRLARRLYDLDGFRKEDVSAHLAKSNDFSNQVAREYVKLFNFAGLRLDAALRQFVFKFCLLGESQERERVLVHFSRRYHNCNPGVFNSEDEVHTLTCAILLLNTDLHGQNLRKPMTCHEFIANLAPDNTGFTYKRDLLKSIHNSIKSTPIIWPGSESTSSDDTAIASSAIQQEDLESHVEYKSGWVLRKCITENDGKRTPFGRRGWRMMYGTLRGTVLYLHKDERGFQQSAYHTYQNAIRITHAYASRAKDYTKKQHVFLLRTATLGEFLFQTSDPEELESWIDSINFVAASFSSPALPAPTGSKQTFHRPLLPTHTCKLSMSEQIAEHERKINETQEILDVIRLEAPPLTAKGRVVQEFFFKERFYEEEKQRYECYVSILRRRQSESTVMTDSVGPVSSVEMNEGTVSRATAHSGQSDRLSYREAIDNWAESEESATTASGSRESD